MEENGFSLKKASGGGYGISLLKSVAMALIVTFAILIVSALLLCFTDFPEKYTLPSAIAATVLGVLAGSYKAAGSNPEKAFVSGLLTALLYSLLAYLVGSILMGKMDFNFNTVLFSAIALATGGVGSYLAGRTGGKPRKYSGGSAKFQNLIKGKGYNKYKNLRH